MTNKVSQTPSTGPAYVAQYLAENPDFFLQHRDLLQQLIVPHDAGAVSLVEHQVQALRERNRDQQGQLLDMMRNARDNERVFEDVLQLALQLIHATELQELANILREQLHEHFHTDAETLLVCGSGDALPPLRRVVHNDMLHAVGCGFPDAAPVCGQLDKDQRIYLFGDFKTDLRSVALLPLGQLGKHGVLAIASRDSERFNAKMGTLFLELIGLIVNELVLKLR